MIGAMAELAKAGAGLFTAVQDGKMEAAAAEAQFQQMLIDADQKIADGQVQQNLSDQASSDKFRTRWRPAAAWICVAGLGYHFLVREMLMWVIAVGGFETVPPPAIDIYPLMTMLAGMLGLGLYRGIEKINGVG